MEVQITARHLDIDEGFKAYTTEKLNRLARYNTKIEEAHAIFSQEKFTYISEITLTGKQFRMAAAKRGEGLRDSFDKCMMNMEKQLKRFHSKAKDHKVKRLLESVYKKISLKKNKRRIETSPVIRSEPVTTKPMSAEEAALELELFKKDFVVFHNSQSEELNVIYRRKDGNYGLIEP